MNLWAVLDEMRVAQAKMTDEVGSLVVVVVGRGAT